jgi:hypothetical protein
MLGPPMKRHYMPPVVCPHGLIVIKPRSEEGRADTKGIELPMNSTIRLFICSIALAIPVFAQSNAIDAAIEGYLRDASGGAIQGGRVTVRNAATNVATQTATKARLPSSWSPADTCTRIKLSIPRPSR